MQINVVDGSSPAMFTAMMFPQATQEIKTWVQEQWNATSTLLTDAGRHYAQQAKTLYDSLTDHTLFRRVRSILGKEHDKRGDLIWEIKDLDDFQSAKPLMQRYIMAQPQLRATYHEQLCDGYAGSYIDFYPTDVGENHYDYQRVMSGIVTELPAVGDEEPGWRATMYPCDLQEGDRELEADEQFCILNVWDHLARVVATGKDPTNPHGGEIGKVF